MSPGVDRSPTKPGTAISLAAGALAVVVLGVTMPPSAGLTIPGVAVIAAGLHYGRERVVTGGGVLLFGGVLVAGVGDAGVGPTLIAGALSVLAWDVAVNAVELGEQVGYEAETRSAELSHAAGTTAVGFGTAVAAYALYVPFEGGRPIVSVVLLTIAAVLLASALRVSSPMSTTTQ
ncbi:DUF7519 family protein [Natranaeroarchaeum aerophilus]|uniref:Uncharacterized protein n=1 Tax=Natranaeroarchaeum aerophilus TaxID=2917711 RepID=A0AAE3FQF6_9EURY|nr:hypothetical protein [Natranaeroarchaeum aerophilus]MCL9813261.1 hypothetical protein [Natranaeroarchaeum aerophilus]